VGIPGYIADRIRTPAPKDCYVVPESTPVVWFGEFERATVATLGLNPSRQEFLSTEGDLLLGGDRRLANARTLGTAVPSAENEVRQVVADCNSYFQRNPYSAWFDHLERLMVAASVASYYGVDGLPLACHLDLVQWATDPVWDRIPDPTIRHTLLERDRDFLRAQLNSPRLRLVLANGRGVISELERSLDVRFSYREPASDGQKESRIVVGRVARVQVIGWSQNLQSAFGVSNALRRSIAVRVSEELARS